ncbi:MAG: hypothetical protein V3V00_00740 [Saprospiraceae bacterium]
MAIKAPHDDELERLFQQGAERYDIDYDPQAWNLMEILLDKRRKKILIYFGLGAMFFLAIVGYFAIDFAEKINSNNEDVTTSIEKNIDGLKISYQQKNQEDSIDALEIESNNNKIIGLSPNTINQNIPEKEKLKNTTGQFKPIYGDKRLTTYRKGQVNDHSISSGSQYKKEEVNDNFISNKLLLNDNYITTNRGSKAHINTNNTIASFASLDVLCIDPLLIDLSEIEMTSEFVDPDISNEIKNYFYIGLVLGAEKSNTINNGFSSLDYNFGIESGVSLSNHLHMKLNGTYIADAYVASKNDYRPPKGYWSTSGAPDQTFAQCNMIEVGLGMQYSLSEPHTSGFYSGIGITTLFMLKEEYYYMYKDPSKSWKETFVNGGNTLLNSIEISFGYNKYLSNRISISLEPYARIPLNGIGHGNVLLGSAGLRVTAKWQTR